MSAGTFLHSAVYAACRIQGDPDKQMRDRPHDASTLGIPSDDLQRCHDLLGMESWRALAGRKIFMTGGTGFVGKWMLATLLDADRILGLNCDVTVLSRDPSSFRNAWPAISDRVKWITGDVRDFALPRDRFDAVIHAATDVVANASPAAIFSQCLDGTRRVVALSRECGAMTLLLVSSGAVYGPLPMGMTHVPETHCGGPDPLQPTSAYAEGKRVAEWLASSTTTEDLGVKVARVFALVGPHLPLDKHFAIGNFLRAAMADEEIVIQGDGTPYRSYLYAADMAAWLWAVLLRGQSRRAYNVGSQEGLSIAALAERVSRVLGRESRIRVLKHAEANTPPVHYVPDTTRTRGELQLPAELPLDEAIERTALWHGAISPVIAPSRLFPTR